MSTAVFPWVRVSGDITKKAGTGLGPRTNDDYEVLYFPSGSKGIYLLEGVEFRLDVPCFIVSRPGEHHEYKYDPYAASRHLFIHFDFDEPAEAIQAFPLLQRGGLSRIPSENELLIGMMKQIIYLSFTEPTRMRERTGALLYSLLTELGEELVTVNEEEGNGVPRQVQRAIQYMEEHLPDPIRVEEIARKVGWSHEHFSRSFAAHTGRTPRDMLMRLRIERACHLLQDEGKSIKQVAFEVGFADENYFSRSFKEIKGMTASAYRKSHANPMYRDLAPIQSVDSRYPINRVFMPNNGKPSNEGGTTG